MQVKATATIDAGRESLEPLALLFELYRRANGSAFSATVPIRRRNGHAAPDVAGASTLNIEPNPTNRSCRLRGKECPDRVD